MMPAHIWSELKSAQSAGRYFQQNIHHQYGEPRAPANPWRHR
ncbi:KTSC domain-containing protein [Delftia acidovorans]